MFEFFSNISKIKFVGELTVDVVFLRLLLAVIFGGLVGIERERKHKPAGFRTYILVWGFYNIAIIAIIFMLIIMIALKKVETVFMKKSSNLIFEIEIDENTEVSKIISECYEVFLQKEIIINKVDKNLKNNIITFNATTEENNNNLSEIVMILSSKNNIKSVKDMSI